MDAFFNMKVERFRKCKKCVSQYIKGELGDSKKFAPFL